MNLSSKFCPSPTFCQKFELGTSSVATERKEDAFIWTSAAGVAFIYPLLFDSSLHFFAISLAWFLVSTMAYDNIWIYIILYLYYTLLTPFSASFCIFFNPFSTILRLNFLRDFQRFRFECDVFRAVFEAIFNTSPFSVLSVIFFSYLCCLKDCR